MIWPFMVPASKLDWTDERKCNAQYVYCFARERGFPAKILDVWRKMYPKNDESDDRWKKLVDSCRISSLAASTVYWNTLKRRKTCARPASPWTLSWTWIVDSWS